MDAFHRDGGKFSLYEYIFCSLRTCYSTIGPSAKMRVSIIFVVRIAVFFCLSSQSQAKSSNFSCSANDLASRYNASTDYLGCYLDNNVKILTEAKISTIGMTPQFCGTFCGNKGYGYGVIEFGT